MAWWKKNTPEVAVNESVEPVKLAERDSALPVIGKHFFAEEASGDAYYGQFEIYRVNDAIVQADIKWIHVAWNRNSAEQIIALLDAAVDREQEKKQNIS